MGFLGGSASKESACNMGDLGSIPGLGRSPGEGKGYPVQYSGLENSMDCRVHGVAELDTTEQLSFIHSFIYTHMYVYMTHHHLYIYICTHIYIYVTYTEDEMIGWHHRLDGHEFEQALGVGDG